MHHVLMFALAFASDPTDTTVTREWMLSPGSCSITHRSAGMLLKCMVDQGDHTSMEWSGDTMPLGSVELAWGAEPLVRVLARAHGQYPELVFNVREVGGRLFLATEPSFAGETLTLPQVSYPHGTAALEDILASFRPDGMIVGLSQPLKFESNLQKPIHFRSTDGSMLDFMDQWLDTYLPNGGRWTLRCNTSMKKCTILVQRVTTATPPPGWIDTDP